jgi:hypothetical protein
VVLCSYDLVALDAEDRAVAFVDDEDDLDAIIQAANGGESLGMSARTPSSVGSPGSLISRVAS